MNPQNSSKQWKDKLQSLLILHGIKEVTFTSCSIYGIADQRLKANLKINISSNFINEAEYISLESNGVITSQNTTRKLAVKYNDDTQDSFNNTLSIRAKMTKFSSQEEFTLTEYGYQMVYLHLKDLLNSEAKLKLNKRFNGLTKHLQNQLNNPFYKNVKVQVYVKQLDSNGNTLTDTTLKTDYKSKDYDVKLNITLDYKGNPTIKHVASSNYLKEYLPYWKREAKARGLDADIEDLRQQVIKDFESQETELSFFKKFIQDSKALLNDNIGGYLEGIQATQKVAKHVWKEGEINESLWYSNENEYKVWPSYMNQDPLVGGTLDGIVDEIVGIPLAIRSTYGIVTDEKQRVAFSNLFTKDGLDAIIEGVKKQALEIRDDEEIRNHFAAQTTVSTAAMLTGFGVATKAAKFQDLIDMLQKIANKYDGVVDAGALTKKLDKIRKKIRKIEIDDAIKELQDEFDATTLENYIDELVEAVNIRSKEDLIKIIKRFRIARKLEKNVRNLITKELAQGGGKYIDELAEKFGKTVVELKNMTKIDQLQIWLPDQKTWTVLDDAFVEAVDEGNGLIYKLYANETKLSDLASLTPNQTTLNNALQEGIDKFSTRSLINKDNQLLKQGTEVVIEKWVQTTGNGVAEATDLTTKILY